GDLPLGRLTGEAGLDGGVLQVQALLQGGPLEVDLALHADAVEARDPPDLRPRPFLPPGHQLRRPPVAHPPAPDPGVGQQQIAVDAHAAEAHFHGHLDAGQVGVAADPGLTLALRPAEQAALDLGALQVQLPFDEGAVEAGVARDAQTDEGGIAGRRLVVPGTRLGILFPVRPDGAAVADEGAFDDAADHAQRTLDVAAREV